MIALWLVALAAAHEPGLSRVSVDGDQLVLQVHRLDAREPPRLLEGTRAEVDGKPCDVVPEDVRPDDNGFVATARLRCPLGQHLRVTAGWFGQLPPGDRTAVDLDGQAMGLVDARSPQFDAEHVPGARAVGLGYLQLGIEHILTGWDHLVFLLGLLLAARSARETVGVVTGFTVAHSLTLSLAVLGVVVLPSRVVEPAIAATIVLVGLEGLLSARRGHPSPLGRRLALTFSLGLVHGLGFAGLLRDLGLPAGHRALALGAFNGGVEVGQLLVVLAAAPLLALARRWPRWEALGVPAGAAGVAAAGLVWLVARIVG
ncbi:MAG: HupE/UreJ family protein [Myxococcota bacterium]